MNIDKTQALLGRLYTNSIFRNEFIVDKQLFYQQHKLSAEAISFMEALSIPQLSFFADGLLKKRMHEVKALLPLSFKLIGKPFNGFLLKFCDLYTPNGIHKHQEDAIHFSRYILAQLKKQGIKENDGQLIYSVLLYEQEQLKHFVHPKRYAFSFYKYDLLKDYGMGLRQEGIPTFPRKFTIVIWKKGKVFLKLN